MILEQFFVEGLGHASYLVGSEGARAAAIVDPRRDIGVYVERANRLGLKIRYALETHNHNDFVSGARQLAAATGAEHVASAEARVRVPHRGVREGDELELGELRIRVLHTPGHTPEHVCYVMSDTARAELPLLIFSGGDLLVGAVGRPDLLGRELGEQLAPLLYDSLHGKILRLEDYVEVLPTHGAGSLCGKGINSKRTTTIGYERRTNPALLQPSKAAFVGYVLSNPSGIPAYYRRMRPLNERGPEPWSLPEPRYLTPEEAQHLLGHGALVLDTRPNVAFGAAHLPGAANVALGPAFTTWVGWLLPADEPIVLVLEQDDLWDEAVTSLARIGYERVAGLLSRGMAPWIQAGLPLGHIPQWSVHDLHAEMERRGPRDGPQVVDVRMPSEWEAGHIAGASHLPLGQLQERLSLLDPARQTAVICGSGYRSSAATSLLRQHGFRDVANVLGGMDAWRAARYPVLRE